MFSGMQWRLIGPFRGGRAVAVSGVPGSGTTFFMGSVGGGVWKTENAGVSWVPLFDGQPVASIGAVAVAPSNAQVIYVGTGESDIRSDLASGDGVYRTPDGGKTWMHVGLKETRQISRIVVDAKNADVVYVAALGHAYGPNPERGVYKSTDGGKTWKQVLNQGPDVGASDLAMAAGNSSVLLAGMWEAHRPPWSTYGPIEGTKSGLYRTTDGGAKWTQLTGHGLPDGKWGRVGVAVSADGRKAYALIDAGKKSGLYRSDDGGETWRLANGDPRLTSRSWYFNQPTIDPTNANVVYVPNVALYRLDEGGTKLSIVRGAPGGDDYHQLWVDPANSARMVLATDQGTSVSVDGGKTWSSWFNQPIGQFYHVTTDNGFPYAVYGAQQDSGSAAVYSRTDHGKILPMDWFMVGGGESGWIVVDSADNNVLYATGAYGGVSRYDRRTSFSQDITPWPMTSWGTEINERKYRAGWSPVLVESEAEKGALYFGTQYVLKTKDGGLNWDRVSGDLTGAVAAEKTATGAVSVENAKKRGFGVVSSIAPSPVKAEVIWAGSDTGLVHVTTDGGKTWSEVTPKGLSAWSKIAMIEASRFDAATAYVAVDRHRLDDMAPYAYRTRDGGKTWEAIAQGIAPTGFVNAIREDREQKGLLFAGTELGVYVSFDDGNHWQPLQRNLPVSSVRDLAIHDDDLVIATHGRAFWVMDNITPLRQIAARATADRWKLFRPAVAYRIDNDFFLGSPFPPDEPVASNPMAGAVMDYYLPAAAKSVDLEVLTKDGKAVRRYGSGGKKKGELPAMPIAEQWFPKPQELETDAGMHRFAWDLRWISGGALEEGDYEDYGRPGGPKVVPGEYEVKLTVDGATQTAPLIVRMDPRSKATVAELAEQQRLGLEVFGQVQQSRQALAEMRSAQGSLAKLKEQLSKKPELQAQADKLGAAMSAIQKGSGGDAMGLAAANSGLQSALRVVESGDRAVPQQALELYRQSSEAATKGAAAWEQLKGGQLAEFNRALQKAGIAAVQISSREEEGDVTGEQ